MQKQLCGRSLPSSVKIPEPIIAAVAEHRSRTVLHYDHNFDRVAEITGQPVEWVLPLGVADCRLTEERSVQVWSSHGRFHLESCDSAGRRRIL